MINDRTAYDFAVNSQGYEGSFVDFQNLPPAERAKYEVGAGSQDSEAFHTGYEASKQNDHVNPYLSYTDEFKQWAEGYTVHLNGNGGLKYVPAPKAD